MNCCKFFHKIPNKNLIGSQHQKNQGILQRIPQSNNEYTMNSLSAKNLNNSTHKTMQNQEKLSSRILTGLTQRSAKKNRNKLKKSSLNFTIFLPDTDSTLAPIVNSRLNSHQMMIDQPTAKVCQHQSTSKMTLP